MPLYNNFRVRYSNFSKSSYGDPLQIKMREKNFIHHYLPIYNWFSWCSHFFKILTLIRNAEFHSFSPFYLDCLSKFTLRKTDLVVWHESTTTEMLLEGWKQPKIAWGEIWREQIWVDNSPLVFSRYFCPSRRVWGHALCWCKIHLFFNSGCFQLTCLQRIFKTLR